MKGRDNNNFAEFVDEGGFSLEIVKLCGRCIMERIKNDLMKQIIITTGIILLLTDCKRQTNIDAVKSDCELKGKYEFNIDSVIVKQRRELIEQEGIGEHFGAIVQDKIDLLQKAKQDKRLLFPFTEVDSAVYLGYEVVEKASSDFRPDKRTPKITIVLCKDKIDAIIDLVNDPNNFGYGECGTQMHKAQIKFYKSGKEAARVIFSCGHGQIRCEPESILTNFGALNENTGYIRLDQIAPWE